MSSSSVSSPHLYRPRSSINYPTLRHSSNPSAVRRAMDSIIALWHRHVLQRRGSGHPRRRRREYAWKRLLTATNFVRLVWVLVLWWGERKVFEDAVEKCAWEEWENWPEGATPHRIALVSDPQLVDPHTYPRRGLAMRATIFYTDLFMGRSYSMLQSELVPETTLFLGDLFDGGREWKAQTIRHADSETIIKEDPDAEKDWKSYTNGYWFKEFVRFEKLFPAGAYRRTIKSLPGNHDLGIGNGIKESVAERFRSVFGETSRLIVAGNHSIVMLDTVSLSNDQNNRIYGPPREFLDSLPTRLSAPSLTHPPPLQPLEVQLASQPPPPPPEPPKHPEVANPLLPTLLLTHVPLYRPPNTPCGPLRESLNPIAIRGGYQYQNVLLPSLSTEILKKTGAKYVFSGDDHDYCELVHMGVQGAVREITVKSFSFAMGVRRPGFLLVSLWNPSSSPLSSSNTAKEEGDGPGPEAEAEAEAAAAGKETVQTKLCLQADQIGIFIVYGYTAIFTLLVLILSAIFTSPPPPSSSSSLSFSSLLLRLPRSFGGGGGGGGALLPVYEDVKITAASGTSSASVFDFPPAAVANGGAGRGGGGGGGGGAGAAGGEHPPQQPLPPSSSSSSSLSNLTSTLGIRPTTTTTTATNSTSNRGNNYPPHPYYSAKGAEEDTSGKYSKPTPPPLLLTTTATKRWRIVARRVWGDVKAVVGVGGVVYLGLVWWW